MVDTSIFSAVITIPGRRNITCVNKSGVYPPGGFNKIENERLEKKIKEI
jgi:hypothetical protein